jgi:tetratricopeptide (TPR) repeat protein
MGRKRPGTGKHVHFCIAVLTCLLLSQCAGVDRSPLLQKLLPQDEARQHLVQAQKLVEQGDYEAALEENQKVLSLAANGPPGDEALFNMGLVYAHPGNSKRDYVKSISLFKKLIKDYAQSLYAERAKVWVQIIQESENAKRVATTLTQENDKLKHMIEESRKVDIEIEEKKREKAR